MNIQAKSSSGREQIEQALWGDYATDGSEQSLNHYIAKLRKYLSQEKQPELRTIPRVEYKFSQGWY